MLLATISGGVGFGEWCVLLAVVLVAVGPKNLPSAARKFGQGYARLRRYAENFRRQLMELDGELARQAADAGREAEDFFQLEGEVPPSAPGPEPAAEGHGS